MTIGNLSDAEIEEWVDEGRLFSNVSNLVGLCCTSYRRQCSVFPCGGGDAAMARRMGEQAGRIPALHPGISQII